MITLESLKDNNIPVISSPHLNLCYTFPRVGLHSKQVAPTTRGSCAPNIK